jgi:hypothetical protein
MDAKIWQQLLGLESVDIVKDWHKKAFDLELNARRAKEITSAAKQAKEFFRNGEDAATTVKSLLTFYGVASLSRATALLLQPGSGEESLGKGHGLETKDWSDTLSGDLSPALGRLGSLKIVTTNGLFSDFVSRTENRIPLHVRSSGVDWRLTYPQPPLGLQLTLDDLLCRLPDLWRILPKYETTAQFASIQEMSFESKAGLNGT